MIDTRLPKCPLQHRSSANVVVYRSSGIRRPSASWLIEAAFVPLMILAGITILVETKKGKLVIESEGAAVNVTLLREGEFYEELKVQPGENATTLLAGKYKIVVDGATDVALLANDQIEIKRGEVVIVRVRQEATTSATASVEKSELIYDGKPLAEWLDLVAREQKSSSLRDALSALKSLQSSENSAQITTCLLQVMPRMRDVLAASQSLIPSNSPQNPQSLSSSIDQIAFSLLRDANPGDGFFKELATELERGELAWQTRILRYAVIAGKPKTMEELSPILDWIQTKVFVGGTEGQLLQTCADFCWERINDSQMTADGPKNDLLLKLSAAKSLGPAFWFSYDRNFIRQPVRQSMRLPSESKYTFFPSAKHELEQRAIAALADPRTEPSYQVQAAIMLTLLNASESDRNGMADSREDILRAVRVRVHGLLESPAEIYSPIPIPPAFVSSTYFFPGGLRIIKASGELRQGISLSTDADANAYFILQLLRMVQALNASAEFSPELIKLYQATAELNEELNQILDTTPVQSLSWPGLRATPRSSATTQHWLAAIVRFQAFDLLPKETQAELAQIGMRTHQSRISETTRALYDVNRDGKLSVEEASKISNLVANFDLNQDQEISDSELLDFYRRTNNQAVPGMRQAPNALPDPGIEWSKKQIAKYDKNSDGVLTKDEWRNMIVQIDGADANGDGAITVEEYSAFRGRTR